MLGISKEEIEFLKELQHELLTQDHVCQASPRFWVVQGTVREYGRDPKYDVDGATLINKHDEWCEIADTMEEAYTYLTEEFDGYDEYKFVMDHDVIEVYELSNTEDNVKEFLYELGDVADFINEYNDNEDFEVCYYKNVDKNYEDTMFLTNRECKSHIKANYYHYPKDAHSYAMTAWRAPEVSKVWNILEKINCDELLEIVEK